MGGRLRLAFALKNKKEDCIIYVDARILAAVARFASRFPSRYAPTLPSRDEVGDPLSRALVPATARFF